MAKVIRKSQKHAPAGKSAASKSAKRPSPSKPIPAGKNGKSRPAAAVVTANAASSRTMVKSSKAAPAPAPGRTDKKRVAAPAAAPIAISTKGNKTAAGAPVNARGRGSTPAANHVGKMTPRPGTIFLTPAPNAKLSSRKAAKTPAKIVTPPPAPPAYVPPPPQAPVPTDGKPRKNQAGFNAKDLEHFRALLLDKRREIVGDMSSMEREALRSTTGSNLSNLPVHMADMGTDNYEQEFTLGLVEKDRQLLREINRALAKIQDGTFGICEGTGKPIGRPRLEVQPWAKFSIEWARQLEKNLLMRR